MWAAKTVTPPISSDSYICGWHDLACRVCHTLSRLVLITGMQCVQAWSQDNEIDQVCIRISCISFNDGIGKGLALLYSVQGFTTYPIMVLCLLANNLNCCHLTNLNRNKITSLKLFRQLTGVLGTVCLFIDKISIIFKEFYMINQKW